MLEHLTIDERVLFIENINNILDSWDGTAEAGQKIRDELNEHVNKLTRNYSENNEYNRITYNAVESQLLIDIYHKEKLLTRVIDMRRYRLSQNQKAVSGKIINNYFNFEN